MLIIKRKFNPKETGINRAQRAIMSVVAVQKLQTIEELFEVFNKRNSKNVGGKNVDEIYEVILRDVFVNGTKTLNEVSREIGVKVVILKEYIDEITRICFHRSNIIDYAAKILGDYRSDKLRDIILTIMDFMNNEVIYEKVITVINDAYYNMDFIIRKDDKNLIIGVGYGDKLTKTGAIKFYRQLIRLRKSLEELNKSPIQ